MAKKTTALPQGAAEILSALQNRATSLRHTARVVRRARVNNFVNEVTKLEFAAEMIEEATGEVQKIIDQCMDWGYDALPYE